MQQPDAINPPHYQGKGMQAIDVIEAFELGYCEGNVLKYLLRWRRKEGVRDLKKAQWYLERLIKQNETTGYSTFYDVSTNKLS